MIITQVFSLSYLMQLYGLKLGKRGWFNGLSILDRFSIPLPVYP